MVRESTESDLRGLLELCVQLHGGPAPELTPEVLNTWERIMADPNHHIIVAEEDGRVVSSCVCVIVPNLTHGQRPYGLIENVVTDAAYRGRGLAARCLDFAKSIARREGCYKLMLLTGSREESTLRFYERAGYNRNDKTAFIQWI